MTRFLTARYKLLSALFCVAVIINLMASACGIKKPQAPSWLSTWELPLVNRSIALSEILERIDNSGIIYDSLGNPGLQVKEALDTVLVDESISMDTAEFDIKDSIGIIEIEPPSPVTTTTYIDQLLPVNIGYVPPVPFDFVQPVERLDNFTWAEVSNGTMDFTFFNLLEVDLDTFIVTVIDSVDLHIIGVLNYNNGLAYMEEETQTLDIAGQRISNAIFMTYHGHTPGGPLTNAGDQNLAAEITFPDTIAVIAARAETPEIVRRSSETYEIEDSTKVYFSTISHGIIILGITNGTELPFDVTLKSPNFLLGGIPFQTSRQLNPGGSSQVAIDLSGYDFIPNDGNPTQNVVINMTSTVQPSAPVEYTFRAGDSLTVHVNLTELRFTTINGRIAPQEVAIDRVSRLLDFPEGFDQANLSQGTVALNILNNSMVPAYVDVIVEGSGKALNFIGIVQGKQGTTAPPAITTLTANPEDCAFFLSPPPPEISMYGSGVINPNYEIVTLGANDSFTGEAVINSPFNFAFGDTVKIRPEIVSISLGDSRPDEELSDRLEFGHIRAKMENALPLGTVATIYIGTKGDSTLYSDPETIRLGPFSVQAAQTDQNGFSIQPAISEIYDSISGSELRIFENDSLYMGEMIDVLPTPSGGVTVTGNDNLRIGARAILEIMMGKR